MSAYDGQRMMLRRASPQSFLKTHNCHDPYELSVIVTSYYEEQSLREYHQRLKTVLEALPLSYEIVMVNDGSTDGTWPLILDIMREDPNVTVALDFAKNAGQTAAMTAGLNETSGARVVFIDSDLQLFPEELPTLLETYDGGYDLVTGYRKDRKDSPSRKLPSFLANIIMRKASQSTISDFGCTFKVYNGDVLRAFGFGPQKIFSNVDVIARMSRYKEIPVSHAARRYGKSGWTFQKLYRFNMDHVVSISDRPFQFAALACFLLALVFLIRVGLGYITSFTILPGITHGLLLSAIGFSFLSQAALLCAVGEFVVRTFNMARELPGYIVRERWIRIDGLPTRVRALDSQSRQ